MAFGGQTPPTTALTETWDGTSWRTAGSLSTARNHMGGSGTATAAFSTGGTPATTATEIFSGETSAAEAADIDFD